MKVYRHKTSRDSAIEIIRVLPDNKALVRFWILDQGVYCLVQNQNEPTEIKLNPMDEYEEII